MYLGSEILICSHNCSHNDCHYNTKYIYNNKLVSMVESDHWYQILFKAPVSTSLQGLFSSYLVICSHICSHAGGLLFKGRGSLLSLVIVAVSGEIH